jgi:hypothetical protein
VTGEPPTDAVGEELLLDNEHVRVWTDVVAPGEQQPLHTHRSPYLSITLTPTHAQVLDADGTVRYDVERAAGEATWFGPDQVPTTHTMRNAGDEQIRVVIVEVLDDDQGNDQPGGPALP